VPVISIIIEKEAAAKLFEEHSSMLLGFLIKLLGNKPDAEDVVQEAFGRLMKRTWKTRNWKAILYRVATNCAYDTMRQWKSGSTPIDLETLALELPHPDGQPGQELIRAELVAELNWALQQLSFNQRAAVLLTLDGHTTREIATILKVTPGTVRNLRSDGHERMRLILHRVEVTNEC
jgi:RNA polymerase sigma-70 factor (ECF subfamily)